MRQLLAVLLIVASFCTYAEEGLFLYGGLGVGYYDESMGDPEITTPNALGRVAIGVGYEFANNADIRFEGEHWSSMQGFPAVFNSPDEDGEGFNALWLKLEKRFYLKR